MAMCKVQFQKGMSMSEFQELYGTEAQCEAVLLLQRWPSGFVCPVCSGKTRITAQEDNRAGHPPFISKKQTKTSDLKIAGFFTQIEVNPAA